MKKLTRKLFISILAAVFAVVALGTSTFAWITISNTASVSAFEGTVEAGQAGIQLSLDYETAQADAVWYTNIPTDVLTAKIKANKFDQFADITSTDGVNFSGWTITENAPAALENAEAVKGKYIEFDVWVKIANATDNSTMTVKLDESKISITDKANGHFTSDAQGIADQENVRVSNAARISFHTTDKGTVIYEQAENEGGNTLGFLDSGFAYSYLIAKGYKPSSNGTDGNLPVKPANGKYPAATKEIGAVAETPVLELAAGTPEKITVRIWVEGWDNECHHNILNQTLQVAFSFTSEDTTPAE